MLVKDWLSEFIVAHQQRHPRQDWPEEGSGSYESRMLWSQWLEAFIRDKVTPDEAEAASRALIGAVVASVEEHLPAILALVRGTRQCDPASPMPLAWAATPEARKAQCEALLDEIYNAGFQFVWDASINQFRCIPEDCQFVNGEVKGPYRRPDDQTCARIRFFMAGLWKLLAPFREPDVEIPPGIAKADWRGLVAALAARGEIRRAAQPIGHGAAS